MGNLIGAVALGAVVLISGAITPAALGQSLHHRDLLLASRTYGTLFAIDPSTGLIRSVVSGPDLRVPAKTVRGSGTVFSNAQSGDLGTSRDGLIFWKLAPTTTTYGTYRIDAFSGNRIGLFGSGNAPHESSGTPILLNAKTLLLAADGYNGGVNANSRILQYALPSGPTSILSGDLIGDGVRLYRGRYMTLADNHTAYVAEFGNLGNTASAGVYRVDLITGAREFISKLGSDPLYRYTVTGGVQSPNTISLSRGTGPVTNGQVRSLLYRSGALYASVASAVGGAFPSGILKIDIATGNRELLVGQALADDGTGATVLTVPASNPGAPSFDAASGLTEVTDASGNRYIVFTSLFVFETILKLNPETRELTLLADLPLQVTSDVRTKMNFTSLAQYTNCPGDLNLDGFVDDADFVLFVGAYDILDCADTGMAPPCAADLNGDLVVDDGDFVGFVVGYNNLVCD